MIMTKGNAYIILSNDNIMNYLLDLSWNYFLMQNDKENKDKSNENRISYELTKLSILNVYKNCIIYIEEQNFSDVYPYEKLETLFVWGSLILKKDENIQTKQTLFEFISDILFSLMNQYCELYNNKINNIFLKPGINIS